VGVLLGAFGLKGSGIGGGIMLWGLVTLGVWEALCVMGLLCLQFWEQRGVRKIEVEVGYGLDACVTVLIQGLGCLHNELEGVHEGGFLWSLI